MALRLLMMFETQEHRLGRIVAIRWCHAPTTQVMHFPAQGVHGHGALHPATTKATASAVARPDCAPKLAVLTQTCEAALDPV